MKKRSLFMLALAMMLILIPVATQAGNGENIGLVQDATGLRYYDPVNVPYQERWKTVDNNTYYFGADGYAKEGIYQNPENKDIYYFFTKADEDWAKAQGLSGYTRYTQQKSGWRTDRSNGDTYLFNGNGVVRTGLYEDKANGVVHYFDPITGKQFKDKWKTVGKDTYLFNQNGVAREGIFVNPESKDTYYFYTKADEEWAKARGLSGYKRYTQQKDGWRTDRTTGRTYMFNGNGVIRKGKYIDPKNGALYFFDEGDGYQYKNKWKTVDGHTHLFNENGVAREGFYINPQSGDKYYFYTKADYDWARSTGRTGYDRYSQQKSGWRTDRVTGQTYLFNGNGVVRTGLFYSAADKATFYFTPEGAQVKNARVVIDQYLWSFDKNGVGSKQLYIPPEGLIIDTDPGEHVRGNLSSKIYHVKGQRYYVTMKTSSNLIIFNTTQDARNAGYRASKV